MRAFNIATFHMGRSGSSVLGSLLNQHPGIFWDYELFSPGRTQVIADRGVPSVLMRFPMTVLYLRMLRVGKKGYGFETQLSQLELLDMNLAQYIQRLQRLKFGHFIIIERKNQLRRIVSTVIGRKTLKWHKRADEAPSRPERITLDTDCLQLGRDPEPRRLIFHLQREQERMQGLKQAFSDLRVLHLTYEDDIAEDPKQAYRRVCKYVGVDCHDVSVRFSKTNPYNLRELLINFEEVKNALSGTAFDWMVDA